MVGMLEDDILVVLYIKLRFQLRVLIFRKTVFSYIPLSYKSSSKSMFHTVVAALEWVPVAIYFPTIYENAATGSHRKCWILWRKLAKWFELHHCCFCLGYVVKLDNKVKSGKRQRSTGSRVLQKPILMPVVCKCPKFGSTQSEWCVCKSTRASIVRAALFGWIRVAITLRLANNTYFVTFSECDILLTA